MKNRKDWVAEMIGKEDWEAAYRRLTTEGRERLGPPPTFEEAESLSRGELPDAEAERVRALLSVYPDLLRVLTEPVPANAENVLKDAELEADLVALRGRMRGVVREEPRPSIPFPIQGRSFPWVAIAAGVLLAVAVGVFLQRTTSGTRQVVTLALYPETMRRGAAGPPAITLWQREDYDLQLVYDSGRPDGDYDLELLDATTDPPRRVWLRDVSKRPDGTFTVRLSTEAMAPGLYRLVLHGADGTAGPVARYTIRLSR